MRGVAWFAVMLCGCGSVSLQVQNQGTSAALAGLTPYSLRHGFITLLAQLKENAFIVSSLARHRNIDVTMKHYVHLNDHDHQSAIQHFEGSIRDSGALKNLFGDIY